MHCVLSNSQSKYFASTLLAAIQALRIRQERDELALDSLAHGLLEMYHDITGYFPNLDEESPVRAHLT